MASLPAVLANPPRTNRLATENVYRAHQAGLACASVSKRLRVSAPQWLGIPGTP